MSDFLYIPHYPIEDGSIDGKAPGYWLNQSIVPSVEPMKAGDATIRVNVTMRNRGDAPIRAVCQILICYASAFRSTAGINVAHILPSYKNPDGTVRTVGGIHSAGSGFVDIPPGGTDSLGFTRDGLISTGDPVAAELYDRVFFSDAYKLWQLYIIANCSGQILTHSGSETGVFEGKLFDPHLRGLDFSDRHLGLRLVLLQT